MQYLTMLSMFLLAEILKTNQSEPDRGDHEPNSNLSAPKFPRSKILAQYPIASQPFLSRYGSAYDSVICCSIEIEKPKKTRNSERERKTKMNPGDGQGGVGEDLSSSFISQWTYAVSRRYQHLLDKSTLFVLRRWIAFFVIAFIYAVRMYLLQGFYIITYALGIYILQLFIAFLSPQVDPEIQGLVDGPTLPTRGSDEFRPFVRRLPEFKFWYSITKAFCFAFVLTFFSVFDVPVFWPILFFYWLMLFISTMKRQIMHMIKYRYVPFSFGKQRYGKKAASADESNISRE